jgi:hypothetical protein
MSKDNDDQEIIDVARCYAKDGSVYYIDKEFDWSMLLLSGRAERIDRQVMTRAQYNAIPATERATDFFDLGKTKAERPL